MHYHYYYYYHSYSYSYLFFFIPSSASTPDPDPPTSPPPPPHLLLLPVLLVLPTGCPSVACAHLEESKQRAAEIAKKMRGSVGEEIHSQNSVDARDKQHWSNGEGEREGEEG